MLEEEYQRMPLAVDLPSIILPALLSHDGCASRKDNLF